jgi:hemerythrin-like domain-containing protein
MSPINAENQNAERAFAFVLEGRKRQLGLCDDLEVLADHLGQGLDYHLAAKCQRYLALDLMIHQQDEEAVYSLLQLGHSSLSVSRLIKLAVSEHERHREYALEVNEFLGHVSKGRRRHDSLEALGYLLRATFENIRQHLEWEEATLFQDARHVILASSHYDLAEQLTMNRQGRLFPHQIRE